MTRAVPTEAVLLAEYSQLKAEQHSRISTRDNLLYATFAAVGGVLVGAFTSKHPGLLLLAPPVILVLGWTYLSNDIKISQLGRYVREELAPKLGGGAFGWELDTEPDGPRRVRKIFQLAADLTAFPLAALALALTGEFSGPLHTLTITLAVAEIAASILVGWMFFWYAELSKS